MSADKEPTINVTRGKRQQRANTSSDRQSSAFPGPFELVSNAVQSVRSLWWAGLGAISVVEDAGSTVFEALVEEGKSWEEAQRARSEETARHVEELSKEGVRAVEAVEERVRDGVNETLHRAGIPHRDDVNELRDQIDTLAERMDRLSEALSEDASANKR